jgi:hypothetical protein
MAIRDSRLYRAEHKTFEAYCQSKWQMERRRAYQLTHAAETAELCTTVHKPANEMHARPLSRLPKESRAVAWEVSVERAPKVNGTPKVTAAFVAEVVAEHRAEPFEDERRQTFDYLNQEVSEHARTAFENEHLCDDGTPRWFRGRWPRSLHPPRYWGVRGEPSDRSQATEGRRTARMIWL